MRLPSFIIFFIALCFVTIIGIPTSLSGQPLFSESCNSTYITIEFLKPNYDLEDAPTLFTSAVFFSMRLPLDKWLGLKAELPFVHADFDEPGGEAQNMLGNPYLGLEIGDGDSRFWGEVGIRFPLAQDDGLPDFGAAATVGFQTDMVKRIEAFTSNILPLTGILHYYHSFPSGVNLLFHSGASYIIHQSRDEKSGWFILYGTHLFYEINQFTLGGGLAGRKWLIADNGNKPNIFEITLSGKVRLGHFIPGIDFKIPVSNELLEGQLDSVIALSLQYVL